MKLGDSFRDSIRDAAQMRQARAFDAFRSHEEEENLLAWESVVAVANRLEHIAKTELSVEACDGTDSANVGLTNDRTKANAAKRGFTPAKAGSSQEPKDNLKDGFKGAEACDVRCETSAESPAAQELCALAAELRTLAHKRLSFADELGFSEDEDVIEMPSGIISAPASLSAAMPEGAVSESRAAASGAVGCDDVSAPCDGKTPDSPVRASQAPFLSADIEGAEDLEESDLEEVVLPVYLCGEDAAAVSVARVSAHAKDGAGGSGAVDPDVVVSGAAGFGVLSSDAVGADAANADSWASRKEPADTAVLSKRALPELIDVPMGASSTEVSTFKHVCAGRDGKLCLFEDKDGHLLAVRSSRLA